MSCCCVALCGLGVIVIAQLTWLAKKSPLTSSIGIWLTPGHIVNKTELIVVYDRWFERDQKLLTLEHQLKFGPRGNGVFVTSPTEHESISLCIHVNGIRSSQKDM